MRYTVAVVFELVLGCTGSLPQGQFGVYHRQSKSMTLASGDTLKVYRLKHWTFQNGSPPALQIEYEAPFLVSDTAAARREARLLWPAFVPYVDAHGLRGAIITATNLKVRGFWPVAWTSQVHHFGVIAVRGDDGTWRFKGDSMPLPPPDKSRVPRIREANGQIVPFDLGFTTAPSR